MRLKFNEDYNANGETYKKGETYDVPNDRRAAMYVKSGVAKAADAEARNAVKDADAPAGKPARK